MKQQLLCRGDGKLYIKVKTEKLLSIGSVNAQIKLSEKSLPIGCYPFGAIALSANDVWVLEVPLMDLSSVKVVIQGKAAEEAHYLEQFSPKQVLSKQICLDQDSAKRNSHASISGFALNNEVNNGIDNSSGYEFDNESDHSETISINFERAKWESRLNYRLRRNQCFEIRDYEQSFLYKHYQPKILQFLEKNDSVIWRIEIQWISDGVNQEAPDLKVFDGKGNVLSAEIYPFELFISEEGNPNPNSYTISLELPKECKYFVMYVGNFAQDFPLSSAQDRENLISPGFCSINPGAYESFKYESWKYMKDARADDGAYQKWFNTHRISVGEWEKQSKTSFAKEPLISIVVPCYRSSDRYLREMVASVLSQSYSNWELLLMDASSVEGVVKAVAASYDDARIKYYDLPANEGIVGNTNAGIHKAVGSYIAFLDHDDLLEPDALFSYVEALNKNPEIKMLFCDEDLFSKQGEYRQPVFKTDLNVDLLYSHNCVTHFLMIETAYLNEIGLSKEEVSGAQDYDLVLRAYEKGGKIHHVSRILYHWREHEGSTSGDNIASKPYAEEAGRIALQKHFDRQGIRGKVETTEHPYVYRMHYELPNPLPLVSVVIPNKDHIEVLDDCVRSLLEMATYSNIEIVLVENNSIQRKTFEYYCALQEYSEKVRVIDWEGDFNYSRIINFGVTHAKGDYILLLNNDTKVITPHFLEEMLGYAMRPDVGVVGAKLYYRDGLIQHAGMIVGPYGAVSHVHQNYSSTYEGYLSRAVRPGNFSAVTGACQLVKKNVFDEVGGYEESLAVGFNDVDFCLKIWRAGYRVVFTPYAELYHYEFTSRGRETFDKAKEYRWKKEQAKFTQRWPEYYIDGDPYVNSCLDRNNFYFDLPK